MRLVIDHAQVARAAGDDEVADMEHAGEARDVLSPINGGVPDGAEFVFRNQKFSP